MTGPTLPDGEARRDFANVLKQQLDKFRLPLDGQEGWRSWVFEICVLISVILAIAIVLQPRVMLLAASPHPFWLPVVAAALIHGTLPGLFAAALAGLCAWLFGPPTTTTEDDFYDLMFRVFKEPVLWLFAAIVLGTFRDRIEEERQRLARERDDARDDLGLAVDHATALRGRIKDLERAIVLAEVDAQPSTALPEDIQRKPGPDVLPPVPLQTSQEEAWRGLTWLRPSAFLAKSPGPDDFCFTWACLWKMSAEGWECVGYEGSISADPERFLLHFCRHPRIYDCRNEDDCEIMPSGALLAVPVQRGAEPAYRVLIVGGGSFGTTAELDAAIHRVLPLVERLGQSSFGKPS
ncbi:hypothetical protein IP69_14640 [Bosea sp. AAP35]|uniref:DUF4118 domain-containing protein n=1 Tax=Bosea sp. AAP35 TaxID=1523417 RepID=UPI0006B8D8C4|nr:DUF4118 domain-containing protein [Bosea sp. AAP35]KPF66548.1 hypothetical protein IP69_14640 [Bosea sp. AAP35]